MKNKLKEKIHIFINNSVIYNWIILYHFAVYLKLTPYCKSTALQLKNNSKKKKKTLNVTVLLRESTNTPVHLN